MPARPEGVYGDGRGGWYFKATLGRDLATGQRVQVTRRGYRSAAEAGRARRDLLGRSEAGLVRPSSQVLIVKELMDLYLDGLDADGRLSDKTRSDYRNYTRFYVEPVLGSRKVRDLIPEVVLTWQRRLAKSGGAKDARPLAPNSIRLARAPLAGAFKRSTRWR